MLSNAENCRVMLRILKNGNKEMEDKYHTVKKRMIKEIEKEKEQKTLEAEKETKENEKKEGYRHKGVER